MPALPKPWAGQGRYQSLPQRHQDTKFFFLVSLCLGGQKIFAFLQRFDFKEATPIFRQAENWSPASGTALKTKALNTDDADNTDSRGLKR
jgi:hypothetical protein